MVNVVFLLIVININLATIIEKNEIDNDYFIELTEYNHLKCKDKIDYHKQPQMDELIITKNISCGEDHSLLLDSDGNIWSFLGLI